MFDNHCHVNFTQLIEDTALGFEKLIHELQLSEIGILSCPRSPKTKVEIDLLENIKALYLKERLSIPVYTYAGFVYHGPESGIEQTVASMMKLSQQQDSYMKKWNKC